MTDHDGTDADTSRYSRARLAGRLIVALSNLHRRMLGIVFAVAGPRVTYALMGSAARLLYRLLDPLRERSEMQCGAALRERVGADRVPAIAEQAFVHRVWSLADLHLAERLLHAGTYQRFGGRIAASQLEMIRSAQRQGLPVILLTGYYGPFDLLPVFLGYNGLRAGVVYRAHANASYDAWRKRIRSRSGCELFPLERAAQRLDAILSAGGTVAIVADHHAERHGQPVTFLGLKTRAHRSVGLLAWRHQAVVVVAGIRRVADSFRFELDVADVILPKDWADAPDAVAFITDRYLRGLESIVLADPTQYLWAYPRWGKELEA